MQLIVDRLDDLIRDAFGYSDDRPRLRASKGGDQLESVNERKRSELTMFR